VGGFVVHTVTAGTARAGSTVEVTMSGTSIWRTTTASLGMSGIRTIQIGNDKQLPFALYADIRNQSDRKCVGRV
jgi:hypothetical protein